MKSIMNPYVGLRPYESHESPLFFGRREQSAALLDKLGKTRFLAVVGSSGCGKSSLIRAGLIPLLRAGFLVDDRDKWHEAVMKPGNRPLYHLAASVCGILSNNPALDEIQRFYETLSIEGAEAIIQRIEPLLAKTQSCMLLLVDQFEEIFRFAQAKGTLAQQDEAAFFVSILLDMAEQNRVPVYTVLTLRSDFIGDCDQFYRLPEAMNQSQYLVPRMTREQQHEAITGPAAIAGTNMSESLVQRVLNDMSNDPDQLPVMQHALMRTWNDWCHDDSDKPTIKHYEAIGTLSKALSNHANVIYDGLAHKDLAMRIFKALTDKGTDERGIRRATSLKNLYVITGAKNFSDIDSIVDTFRQAGCSFLMPSEKIPLAPDVMVDISHESLMRVWDRLEGWVKGEAKSVGEYRRLSETTNRFNAGKADFLRDPELKLFQNWYEEQKPNFAWADQYHTKQERETNQFEKSMQFLEDSIDNQDKETAEKERLAIERQDLEKKAAIALEEKQKNEALKRAAKYQRRVLSTVLWALMLAIGMAIFSGYQYYKADRARKDANEQRAAAMSSAQIAEEERQIAEQERQKADAEKEKATTAQKEAEQRLSQILKLEDTLFPLAEEQGRLYILGLPDQSSVDIKGVDQPYASGMKLSSGNYEIQLSHKDYYSKKLKVDVKAGKENQVKVSLLPLPSELRISGKPHDAVVIVNEVNKGKGKVVLDNLKPGRYQIRVEKVLFEPFITDIVLGPNEERDIKYDLPGLAKLTVVVKPSDARIRILNIRPVYTAGMILSPGKYQIEITSQGYISLEHWVTLEQGDWQIEVVLEKEPEKLGKKFQNRFGMSFVFIPPGKFMMGSPQDEKGRSSDEVQHEVILTKGFYMQTTEVTQGQWMAVMGKNPSYFQQCGKECPVEQVSWNGTQEFIQKLKSMDGNSAYRLPTEAEWEYAARAGSKTAFANGEIKELICGLDPNLDKMGWYCGNSQDKTHPVAQKQANAWGLYDMHGNVWEWCADWFGDYPKLQATDPVGSKKGSSRVLRGGSWYDFAGGCRSANRDWYVPTGRGGRFGFRLVVSQARGYSGKKSEQGAFRLIERHPTAATGGIGRSKQAEASQ
ncbi:Sulphatase-modifying factor domain protein [Candidatus Magnetomorum sp. HK-1]|nr:Sulphatase-modifying factor domain protein [Candidatus Magnetomorum sp. HK-1]